MSVELISITYGVLAAIGWGLPDLFMAAASKRLGVMRSATGVHIASILVATAYMFVSAPLHFEMVTPIHWAALAGMAVLAVLMYIAFYRALQLGPVSAVAPIASTHPVVVILLAVTFAGETLNMMQIIGITAAIGGAALTAFSPEDRLTDTGKIVGLGVVFAGATILCVGLWQYSLGIMSREIGWFLPVYVSRLMSLGMFIPMTVAVKQFNLNRVTLPLAAGVLLAGLVEIGGLFAFARGSEEGIISLVTTAASIYLIIPIVGGVVIFRERLALNQWVGVGITLVGIITLALAPGSWPGTPGSGG